MLKRLSLILKATLLLIVITASTLPLANAQQAQEIINQQDWITRNQQNEIEKDRRTKEQKTIREERKRRQEEEKKQENDNLITGQTTSCIEIKKINLTQAKSVSKKNIDKLTKPFLGQCFEAKMLSKLISIINSYYSKKGFVTARVSVPQQNVQNGILELNILEGVIGEINYGDDAFTDKMQKFTAFGNAKGNTLNINDINQGIYQINRLSSNNAAVKVEPSNDDGEADISITNQRSTPVHASIGYDNLGNEFTGIHRTNFTGSFDNLLFLNDNINLSYSTNLNDDSSLKDIRSFSGGISVPFKYNTLSYDYSRSEFRGTNQGTSGPIKLSGYSDRNNVTLDRVLLNKGNLRISGNTSLTEKKTSSYLNDLKIETSERRLTIGNIGLTISNYFKNGLNLYVKPSYSRGLKLFNAKQDLTNISTSTPKAQFDVFKLYASASKNFIVPKVGIPIQLTTEIESQYAKQTIFGSEQFSVGGYYSVRGFRENYITGDSGYYLRNKANVNLLSLISPFTNGKNISVLSPFYLEPFYDYGYVQNKYDGSDGRLSGAGIKTIFATNQLQASLTYSWANSSSSLVTSDKKENSLVYFEVTVKCC